MRLFVDTFNLEALERAAGTGVLGGVTHNPVGMSKEGPIDYVARLRQICALLDRHAIPGPINTEILTQVPGGGRRGADGGGRDGPGRDRRPDPRQGGGQRPGRGGRLDAAPGAGSQDERHGGLQRGAGLGGGRDGGHRRLLVPGGPLGDATANATGGSSARPDLVGPVREIYDRYGYPTKILQRGPATPIDVARVGPCGGRTTRRWPSTLFMALAHDPWTDIRLAGFMAQVGERPGGRDLGREAVGRRPPDPGAHRLPPSPLPSYRRSSPDTCCGRSAGESRPSGRTPDPWQGSAP